MGDQETVATDSLQPYLSAINKFLQDHDKTQVALGPINDNRRPQEIITNCQRDLAPKPERLPLPALVALALLAKAEVLLKVFH
jgi:hypothetical protein